MSLRLGFGALTTGVAARRPDGSVVDLSHLGEPYRRPDLMGVLGAGPGEWERMRAAVDTAPAARAGPAARPLLPIQPGDYVDFYACEHHARNLGRRLRPDQPELPPAWPYVPLAYHGRSSTVVVSGEPVTRPQGMRRWGEACTPTFGPTAQLDVEVELGLVVGRSSTRGRPLDAATAESHLFGVVVLNDWSARDIQAFETVPLGPHIGKSFCTSISPWVVPLDLLDRCEPASDGLTPAPYLEGDPGGGLDVELVFEVDGARRSVTNARHLSWTPGQLLAQLTSGGAHVRPGDLIGTGTISGPQRSAAGSCIELGGPFLRDGETATVSSPQLGSVEGRIVGCPITAR